MLSYSSENFGRKRLISRICYSDESMVMDPSEVDAVIHREAPKLVNENRNFLDFGWLLPGVMEGFSKLAVSLLQLTCKG